MADEKTEPAHYRENTIQPIDAIEAWGLGFCLGQVVKYVQRAGRKPGESALDDLRKARWYLEREVARLEREAGDG